MSRKLKDTIANVITYIFSSFSIVILLALMMFIISKGYKLLSWDLITGDYYKEVYDSKSPINPTLDNFENPNIKGSYFSSVWGISVKDSVDKENNKIIEIIYVDEYSPFNNMVNSNNENLYNTINKGHNIDKIISLTKSGTLNIGVSSDGAKKIVNILDNSTTIRSLISSTEGGGIRGSIITTFYLIILTLIIALPLGIISAIYLHEFSSRNNFTNIIRSFIDMLSGIPSIIFGLLGAIVFIPFTSTLLNSDGGNLLSGALTLAVILLPVIIKTTEEALMTIPASYRNASLALGASQVQTTFKIVLPSAIPGILTATLLSIGRIIGESAALIYAVGTSIKDQVSIADKSTSLSVHIWSLMSGERPNLELSSAISIIILIVVFVLSTLTKLISKRLVRVK